MTDVTPNYGLALFNDTTDPSTQDVLDFRTAFSGDTGTSNMDIIDSSLGDLQDQLNTLLSQKGFIKVYANEFTTNVYVATGVLGIDSYVVSMSILLALDTSITGTTTLNINSLGTLSLMKINSSGTAVNLNSGDLSKERFYIFTYDGTRWVWDNAFSSDQINIVSGVSGNFTRASSAGILEDSGSSPSTFAVAAKGVTNGDSHDHSGGDGGQIDFTTLSNVNDRRTVFYEHDFLSVNATANKFNYFIQTYTGNGGAVSSVDGDASHYGVANVTAILSISDSNIGLTMNPLPGLSFEIIFKIASGNPVFGFVNNYASGTTTSTEGARLVFSSGTLTGKTTHSSVTSTTSTSYSYSTGVWYRATMSINASSTSVVFTLYDSPTTTTLWTDTLTTNIPTSGTVFAIYCLSSSVDVDYFKIKYPQNR